MGIVVGNKLGDLTTFTKSPHVLANFVTIAYGIILPGFSHFKKLQIKIRDYENKNNEIRKKKSQKRKKIEINVLKSFSSFGSSTARKHSSKIIGIDTAKLQNVDILYSEDRSE